MFDDPRLGPVGNLIVLVVTIAVVSALGLALRYADNTGNLWWALPLTLAGGVWLFFIVTDRKERHRSYAEMAENFSRWRATWKRWLSGLSRTR